MSKKQDILEFCKFISDYCQPATQADAFVTLSQDSKILDLPLYIPIHAHHTEPKSISPYIGAKDITDSETGQISNVNFLNVYFENQDASISENPDIQYSQVSFAYLIQLVNIYRQNETDPLTFPFIIPEYLQQELSGFFESSSHFYLFDDQLAHMSHILQYYHALTDTTYGAQVWQNINFKQIKTLCYDFGLKHERIQKIQCYIKGIALHIILDTSSTLMIQFSDELQKLIMPFLESANLTLIVQQTHQMDETEKQVTQNKQTIIYQKDWIHHFIWRWFRKLRPIITIQYNLTDEQ